MAWYAAHIVSFVKFKDGVQDKYPIWENVVLIEASTENEAYTKAEQFGRNDYQTNNPATADMTWEGRPAYWVFGGIRKLTKCSILASVQDERDELYDESAIEPATGMEVTYMEFEVDSEDKLRRLIDGEPVTLAYDITWPVS